MFFQKFSWLFLMGALGELYLFVKVAVWIGFLPMVLLAAGTSMLGVVMLRLQGAVLWEKLSLALTRGELPAPVLLEGGMGWLSAVLLIIPGFLTDIAAFILLIPPLRRAIIRFYLRRAHLEGSVTYHQTGTTGPGPGKPEARRPPLEGESRRED